MSKRIAFSTAVSMCTGLLLAGATCSFASDTESGAQLVTVEPKTPIEHNNRAEELAKHGRWTEAINEHQAAVAGEPNNKAFKASLSTCLLRCGDRLMDKKDYESAAALYKRALEADSENLSAKSGLNEASKLASASEQSL